VNGGLRPTNVLRAVKGVQKRNQLNKYVYFKTIKNIKKN